MANLYVGPDGMIHSGSGEHVQGAVSVTTSSTENADENGSASTYRARNRTSYVSTGRIAFYWIFTMITGALIGIGAYVFAGKRIFSVSEATTIVDSLKNWFYGLAPYAFLFGGETGSICYGTCFAPEESYNLEAIVMAMLSAVIGTGLAALALGLAYLVVIAFLGILMVILAGSIVGGILAGLLEG